MKHKAKKRINAIISIFLGVAIFGFFLLKTGPEAINMIIENINFFYFGIYFFLTTMIFFLLAWRWQIVLKAYNKRPGFWKLLRQTIAGYAVAYVTPSVRLGGEPLRVYMLKKEANIDYKTGTSSVIMDKFVELLGTVLFGVLGLVLLLTIPASPIIKIVLSILLIVSFLFLGFFYYFTALGKAPLSKGFNFLRLYKIPKMENLVKSIVDVEKRLENFFVKHKKQFLLSIGVYLIYGFVAILEMKFLFLTFGVNASLLAVVLALTVLGIANLIPVPAGVGFLEAGQSGLFSLLRGKGSIGFAFSLMTRIRSLIFVAIGFGLISHFSGEEVRRRILGRKSKKKYSKNGNNKKKKGKNI